MRKANKTNPFIKTSSLLCVHHRFNERRGESWVLTPEASYFGCGEDRSPLRLRPRLGTEAGRVNTGDHEVGPGDLPLLGQANITVSINNREVEVDFLVTDIEGNEVLLGCPFLTQAEAQLDFGKHRVLFGEGVPYVHLETAPKSHAVRVARTVMVEPGHEYLIRGTVHGNQAVSGNMMLSPTKGFVEKHTMLIARVLLRCQCPAYHCCPTTPLSP